MVTSVGHDAATACASIRAGIQRPAQLTYYRILDEDEQSPKPLVGRPLSGLTDGFLGVGRWSRLASLAMHDLARRVVMPGATDVQYWSRTAVFAVAPENDIARFWLDDGVAVPSLEASLASLLDVHGWPVAEARTVVLRGGHAGFARAVAGTLAALRVRSVDRVIVLCADSYVDAASLAWLDETERLKTEDNAFGVIPGEAAACVLFSSVGEAPVDGAPGPVVEAAVFSPGVSDHRRGEQMLGQSSAHSISEALSVSGQPAFQGTAYADLNGEPWRAQELGSARVRLRAQLGEEVEWILPADSLGEVGAASGAIALSLGAIQLSRIDAMRDSRVAVLSLSESGASGCVLLRMPVH